MGAKVRVCTCASSEPCRRAGFVARILSAALITVRVVTVTQAYRFAWNRGLAACRDRYDAEGKWWSGVPQRHVRPGSTVGVDLDVAAGQPPAKQEPGTTPRVDGTGAAVTRATATRTADPHIRSHFR
ncbi:helix-turn-helix domain-containing protein [Actinomadura napierensis]